MESLLTRVAGSVLGLLLPLNCAVCGREGRALCRGCEVVFPRLEKPYCSVCAGPGPARVCESCAATPMALDGIRAPYLFDRALREMVHRLKYNNLRASAPDLGRLLALYLKDNPMPCDVVMPVPLHKRRERERGYNQSELLARELGERTGMPVETRVLRRNRNTPPQVSMKSHEERRRNIEGAFECGSSLEGKSVLLIDDVVATGSTMSACGAALKAAGAGSVWGLALARQPQ